MREKLDPSEYGGAPLLGVSGVSIIAHGSSNPKAIRNAIRAAANEQLVHHVNAEILEILAKIQPVGPIKPAAGKGIRALFGKMRGRLQRREKEGEAAKRDEAARARRRGTGSLSEPRSTARTIMSIPKSSAPITNRRIHVRAAAARSRMKIRKRERDCRSSSDTNRDERHGAGQR